MRPYQHGGPRQPDVTCFRDEAGAEKKNENKPLDFQRSDGGRQMRLLNAIHATLCCIRIKANLWAALAASSIKNNF